MGPAFQIHLEPLQVSSSHDALEGSFHFDLHASFHTLHSCRCFLRMQCFCKRAQLLCMAVSINWIIPDASGLIVHTFTSSVLQSSYTGTSQFFLPGIHSPSTLPLHLTSPPPPQAFCLQADSLIRSQFSDLLLTPSIFPRGSTLHLAFYADFKRGLLWTAI